MDFEIDAQPYTDGEHVAVIMENDDLVVNATLTTSEARRLRRQIKEAMKALEETKWEEEE